MGGVARKMGPFRWADFVALDDDDRRELIDGELVEIEVPKRTQERVVMRLGAVLVAFVEKRGGEVLASGYKIRITERRGVMPDLQLYRTGNEPDVDQEDGLVRGRPDLVVEVISPNSRRYDRVVKLGYYASLEIPEYWIVDPETKTLERLTYSKKGYVIASTHEGATTFAPPSFPGVRLPLEKLWPRGSEGA